MRTDAIRIIVAVAGLMAAVGPLRAEPPRIAIHSVSVGLPAARGSAPICKFACWAPVEVELEWVGEISESASLLIESPDCDGVTTSLALPLDSHDVRPGARFRQTTYVRPAAGGGETTLLVRDSSGKAISEPFRLRSLQPREPLSYIVLSLGSPLAQFALPKPETSSAEASPASGLFRGGRVELAAYTEANRLPGEWFAYDTADLVILSTSSREFLRELAGNEKKMAALREWVARGGRLAIAVGSNARDIKAYPALEQLLPFAVAGSLAVPSGQQPVLPLYWSTRETSQTSTLSGNLSFHAGAIANLIPKEGQPARVVIPPASRAGERKFIGAAQAAHGLGRITLIGFDLDRSPFTEFDKQAEFWDWVLRECGASRASVGSEGKPYLPHAAPSDDEDEVAVALRTHLDTFAEVPVVSFGSVAFLIGLYILLIGPIEYYFLRRVFGRIELTWFTFPIIVATVCVAAFVSASALKGHDLRVNKLDVVDVALEPGGSGRVVGTSWFTLFSPRIEQYSVASLPASEWGPNPEPGVASWLGGPRAGRASLMKRTYGYHVGASSIDGLDRVPVQTWATKSFTANWSCKLDKESPVIESRLLHPPGAPTKVFGTFVNRMPFEAVADCVAFYAGQAYPIGTIVNGQEVRLVLDRGTPAQQWLQERGQLAILLSRSQALGAPTTAAPATAAPATTLPGSTATRDTGLPLWGMLFHEASLRNEEGVVPRNASLRRLDQSWRLTEDHLGEVIVVGRVLPKQGSIGDLLGGSESPSRVRLHDGPAAGFAHQETYLRLFLPVKSPDRVHGPRAGERP